MGACVGALILLSSIVLSIDTFVVCEINIFFVTILRFNRSCHFFMIIVIILSFQTNIVLVISVIWELVEVILILMLTSIHVLVEISASLVVPWVMSLLCMNSSLIGLHHLFLF